MATEYVQGMSELLRKLKELPKAVQNGLMDDALMAGGEPMLDTAKAVVAVDKGTVRDSLKLVQDPPRKHSHRVRLQTGEGDYKGESFHGAFLEYGTAKMTAKPYMRPGFDQNVSRSIEIIGRKVGEGIEREASK